MPRFYMPAPGADTRFDRCFVGDIVGSTPSICTVADRVWSETLQATRPGRERVEDFNERAFEANLHMLVLVECGFDRSDLEKPKVRAALQRRLAFGTVHSDYVASRRSLVLTTKSVHEQCGNQRDATPSSRNGNRDDVASMAWRDDAVDRVSWRSSHF